MAPAAAAAITVVLGDDLLREVFVRLPTPEDLVRAATACKPFLRAARSPPFLRRFRRLHPFCCPRILGCLAFHPSPHSTAPEIFTSSSSSTITSLAHAGAYALSYLPGGGWLGDSRWQLLDCRNGRVLVKDLVSQELGITDPLSRCYIVLPAPPTECAVGWGLVADDGDSSVFQVVCISRDSVSRELRALIMSSGDFSWADIAGVLCQPDLTGFRAMQANQSLYWKLEGGERMVAFSMVTMEFSLLDLPPSLRELSFDVIEKREDDGNVLCLLTMTGFCIEVWAGTAENNDEIAWRRLDKSVRFHKLVKQMFRPSAELYQQPELDVVGVVAGVVFIRQWDNLFSIDLETMKLSVLSQKGCSPLLIYPYTIAWPPSFLNPGGQGALLNVTSHSLWGASCFSGKISSGNQVSGGNLETSSGSHRIENMRSRMEAK